MNSNRWALAAILCTGMVCLTVLVWKGVVPADRLIAGLVGVALLMANSPFAKPIEEQVGTLVSAIVREEISKIVAGSTISVTQIGEVPTPETAKESSPASPDPGGKS
jgi:hypothetical protein